jgi:phosphoserine phosphatase
MIFPVAKAIGVPEENVHANQFLFHPDGTFRDFDREKLTSRTGGKKEVVSHLKKQYNYKYVVMIGDGATDLESRTHDGVAADFFIGFGGNQERAVVKEKADLYVYSFNDLIGRL